MRTTSLSLSFVVACVVSTLFILISVSVARRSRQMSCANSLIFCPLVLDDVEPGYDFIRISVPDMKLKLQGSSSYPQTQQRGRHEGQGQSQGHRPGTGECSQWECNYLIDNGPIYSDYLKFLRTPQTLFLLGARIGDSINFSVSQCPGNLTQNVEVNGVQLSPGAALAGNEAMNATDKAKLLEENYQLLNLLLVQEFKRQRQY